MNGISLMMSISCCPMYNLGTSNYMKLIPRRPSNFHLQTSISPPLGTTTQMLKHPRVYSASSSSSGQDTMRRRPEIGGTDGLIFLWIGGLALFKAWEIVAQLILTMGGIEGNPKSICKWAAIILAAGFIVGKIHDWLLNVTSPSFSIGDVVKFGSMEGQVIETGPVITLLRCAHGGLGVGFTNTLFASKVVINKSSLRYHAMDTKITIHVDAVGKIRAISEDIENMMKSNSNVYLEEEQPYCCCSGFKPHIIELTLVFKLKKMSEDKLGSVKEDILDQSFEILMKHGAKLA